MWRLALAIVFVFTLGAPRTASAFNILAPGDPIIAIDLDFTIGSASPGAEGAENLLDENSATKYLNFGITDTGFIVTPDAASTMQSFVLTTANDFPGRDPGSYTLFGTNDPITSIAHGSGREENWTEISSGALSLPDDRFTQAAPVGFSNSTSYSSYKMVFPTIKDPLAEGSDSMQVADVGFFSTMDGTGAGILGASNPIIPIRDVDPQPSSNFPGAEGPENVIDQDPATKYLNFGEERSGFIVTPAFGAVAASSFQITTANDAVERDPATWEIYGTNEAITTPNNGVGDEQNWTLIDSGSLDLPAGRGEVAPEVAINNTSGAFSSYRVIFPTVKDEAAANSMQIAEFALLAEDNGVLEVNRQTGEVVLRATNDLTLSSYSLESLLVEGLDASNWDSIATTGADPNDTWSETTATDSTLAESDDAGGADDGLTITAGNSYSFGEVWKNLASSLENLIFDGQDGAGTRLGVGVEFIGTEVPIGDYSRNGSVGIEDWPFFRAAYGTDSTGFSLSEAYLAGDLDGDFDSDIFDFNIFVAQAGGAAALFGGSVPEPSSFALIAVLAGVACSFRSRRASRLPLACGLLAGLTIAGGSETAQAQTFLNVGGVPSSITIPAGQQNEAINSGPQQFFDDTFLDDPGIIDGELFLLDYNDPDLMGGPFLQYAGLGADPKVVFMDYGSSVTANWFAYSQRSGADPTADRVGTFEFWFSNTDFGGVLPATAPDASFQLDPADNRLRDSALRPYTLNGDHSGQYVALRLTVSELSSMQATNNIGGHEFRLLDGPGDVVLEVDRADGSMTLRNNRPGSQSIAMNSYSIESPLGGLDSTQFNGVAGDNGSFPVGNGSGNGWEIGGGSNSARLVETYFSSQSTLASGTSGLDLGAGYNALLRTEDLTFKWSNSEGDVFDGIVEYVGDAPLLPGDYSNNGIVDAIDYAIWREALGTSTVLPNDSTPGVVDSSDYDAWKQAFGLGQSGASAAVIPEPATLSLLVCALAFSNVGVRRSRTSSQLG